MKITRLNSFVVYSFITLMLAGCQDGVESLFPKAQVPISDKLIRKMKARGMVSRSPILIRLFKQENVLEVWKKKDTGRYDLLKDYEICKWSGKLGPKFKEGDRQSPEGFYSVTPARMNPQSSYHLSFNTGYPNAYDRSHDRTGSNIMVHGSCASIGCYAMTDERVEEIYALAREAFQGGQKSIQVQIYPFRMTPENMAKHKTGQYYEFWKMLKKGNDYFEIAKYPLKVNVCEKRYVFNRQVKNGGRFKPNQACPESVVSASLEEPYLKKVKADEMEMAKIRAGIGKKEQLGKIFGLNRLVGFFKEANAADPDINKIKKDFRSTKNPDLSAGLPKSGTLIIPVPSRLVNSEGENLAIMKNP